MCNVILWGLRVQQHEMTLDQVICHFAWESWDDCNPWGLSCTAPHTGTNCDVRGTTYYMLGGGWSILEMKKFAPCSKLLHVLDDDDDDDDDDD